MWERIREIVTKEFRQVLRDPRMRTILIVPPIVQTIVFGFAVNLDVEKVRLGWLDLDHTRESRELLHRFTASPYFDLVRVVNSQEEAESLIERGQVQAIARINAGFAEDVSRGNQTGVQVLIDGANSNTAGIIANYAASVIAVHNQQLLRELQLRKLVGPSRAGPIRLSVPGVRTETRVWFNPELKSRNYFVPGVIVNIITIVTLMLTALAIVREKEIGTMEQIMVTPIRPIELMMGKTIPFALAGLLDIFLITTVALVVFGIPLRGSLLFLLVSAVAFLLTTLGAGLFLSTVSHTQQQAMMGSFFFFMPAFMLSGFAFPIRNMPEPVQWITYVNPLRYFMEIVRGVFLKGTGIETLWPQLLAMAAFGVAILTFSATRFHKSLD